MEMLVGVLLMAILVQFLVDRLKAIIPVDKIGKLEIAPIYALILGVSISIVSGTDMLALIGFKTYPIFGEILTGIAVSGGSSAVHELISKLRESRQTDVNK